MKQQAVVGLCLVAMVAAWGVALVSSEAAGQYHEVYTWGRNNAGQLGLVSTDDVNKPTLVSVLKGKHITAISMGGSDQVDGHTLALASPGKLYATGDNTYGQLGLSDNTDRDVLVPVPRLFRDNVVSMDAGEAHSVAVTHKGEVFTWGSNTRNQLGHDDSTVAQLSTPKKVKLPKDVKITGVTAGAWHTVVWTSTGAVYAWGDNSYGQLGVGDKKPRTGPVQVQVPPGGRLKLVVAGGHHNLALTEHGTLVGWGKNSLGQLGMGEGGAKDYPSPAAVPGGTKFASLSLGHAHSMAVTDEGSLFGFGDNSGSQLGVGEDRFRNVPSEISPQISFSRVVCGRSHTIGVTLSGKLYSWGTNALGQLGQSDLTPRAAPSLITLLNGKKVQNVATGSASVLVLLSGGEVFGWGRNNAGQLGIHASKVAKTSPEFVMSTQKPNAVVGVAAGGYAYQYEGHSAVVMATGEFFSWGWNAFGQLGIGEVEDSHPIPQKNTWLSKVKVVQIACGQFATAAVTDDGTVYTWGLNDSGQLGKGDFSSGPVEVPQRIHIDAAVSQVAVGYAHMLAVTVDGRVYAWGRNFYGQLGVGDHKDKNSPQLISYLQEERVVQVAAGQYHALAVTARGEVYGWGYNRDYELGVGDNMDRVLPQVIPSLADRKVVQVAAGGYHSLAVTDEGALYSWGMNNYGQLGFREKAKGKVPVLVQVTSGVQDGNKQVGKRMHVKSVAAGTWHTVAIAETGSVFSWGRCQYGQLGVKCEKGERSRDVYFPERVEELEDKKVVAISAGAAHSIAVVESHAY